MRLTDTVTGCLLLLLVGCAPAGMIEGVPWITAKHKVKDAKLQRVEHYSCVRFDVTLLDGLDRAAAMDDLAPAQDAALAVLTEAHMNSIKSTRNELDRLPPEGWQELNARYFDDDAVPDNAKRQHIWATYLDRTEARYRSLRNEFRQAQSLEALRSRITALQADVRESIKTEGRLARALPWALFAPASALAVASAHADEYRGVLDKPFEAAVRYQPGASTVSCEPNESPHWELLMRYAPVIVQERPARLSYAPETNRIGRVIALDTESISIDTRHPAVYAYAREIPIGDNTDRHVQLVYTYWYPEHPPMKDGSDPEAGHIEGLVVRITLNTDARPALFETLYACGCYHRLYPAEGVEEASAEWYGRPEDGKTFSLERAVRGRFDLIIPKVIDDSAAMERPVVRSAAGHHAIIDVAVDERHHRDEVRETIAYELLPYDRLEHITLSDGTVTSMFYDNGLVKGAQRGEGVYFTPIGILSAGQPRQRGTQLIHWDHWDFDDPRLFVDALRLPDTF